MCPRCHSANVVEKTYRPMGREYWRFTGCNACGHEEHRIESPIQAAARVMATPRSSLGSSG